VKHHVEETRNIVGYEKKKVAKTEEDFEKNWNEYVN
jgi:hypothetical protein